MKRIVYHTVNGLLAVLVLLLLVNACKKEKIEKPETPFQIDSYYPNSGKAGTLVKITGEGFPTDLAKYTATFSNTSAEVLSAESNLIIVRAPENGSSGQIVLNTGNQTVDIGDYTYQDLSVQRVFPANGPAGSHIRISGEGFSSLAHPAVVSINKKEAIVVSASDTLLVAEVPEDAGSGAVTVNVDGMESVGQSFTFQAIRSIKPLSGGKGTRVTISGEGFEELAAGNVVNFNGKAATVEEAGADRLIVMAPDAVTTGPLSVTINGQKTTGPVFTVVPPPGIQTVSPLSGPAGTTMKIIGTEFSAEPDENKVFINGKEVPIESATANELTLTLPGGTGSGKISVVVNDQATEGPKFLDQTLGILSVSPDNGLIGTEIVITGTGFDPNPSENQVIFNGVAATVTSATENQLVLSAPEGLSTGNLIVRVGNQEALAPTRFRRAGVETLTGGPGNTELTIAQYGAIAVDAQGNVFVTENNQSRIKKITPDGVVSIFAGSSSGVRGNQDGQGEQALFNFGSYAGLVADAQGNLFVSDGGNNSVRKISPSGAVSTLASDIFIAGWLSIDPAGNLYLPQSFSGYVRITPAGVKSSTSAPSVNSYSGGKYAVANPEAIYYVGDLYRSFISSFLGSNGSAYMWVGNSATGFADGVGANALFSFSIGSMVFDQNGSLLVLDQGNYALRSINLSTTEVSTVFKGTAGYLDGTLREVQFRQLTDIAVGPDGAIYILDGPNQAVRKVFLE